VAGGGGGWDEFIKVAVGDVNIYRWDRNSYSDFISFTGCEENADL
jgi:hypothetical protein